MKKLVIITAILCVVLLTGVFAYTCINQEDNDAVKEFKTKINLKALEQDINSGITPEAFALKIKYFNPCS